MYLPTAWELWYLHLVGIETQGHLTESVWLVNIFYKRLAVFRYCNSETEKKILYINPCQFHVRNFLKLPTFFKTCQSARKLLTYWQGTMVKIWIFQKQSYNFKFISFWKSNIKWLGFTKELYAFTWPQQ